MGTIRREEIYEYRDRAFNMKVLDKSDGFHVIVADEKTKKMIDRGKCSHENYLEICKKGISKDTIEYIVAVMKKTVNLCQCDNFRTNFKGHPLDTLP